MWTVDKAQPPSLPPTTTITLYIYIKKNHMVSSSQTKNPVWNPIMLNVFGVICLEMKHFAVKVTHVQIFSLLSCTSRYQVPPIFSCIHWKNGWSQGMRLYRRRYYASMQKKRERKQNEGQPSLASSSSSSQSFPLSSSLSSSYSNVITIHKTYCLT